LSWNGSDSKVGRSAPERRKVGSAPRADRNAPAFKKGIFAGLLVVIGAGFAALIIGRGQPSITPQTAAKPKTSRIAEATPQIVTQKVEEVAKDEADDTAEKDRKAREAAIQKRREMMKKMTVDEKLEFLFEEAKKRPLRTEPGKGRIFATGLEQSMDWVFSCEVGNPPPLLPEMSLADEAHLAEILVMDNPIKEDDSERAKEAKATMAIAKKAFRDFIKEGGDPYDFLPYYHNQLVQAHEEFKMARKTMIETVKNDPDIAPEFIKKVNDDLAAKGIKQVELPPRMLEKYNVQLLD